MLSQEPQLAPVPLMICYLARFQRFFAAVIDYTQQGDKAGMLLGGYLADALHNVPSMLWRCSPDEWFNPMSMETWMQEFSDELIEGAAPQRLLADSRRILSAEGGAKELGLRSDLSDVHLAPVPDIHKYLEKLSDSCLMMRFMRNFGNRPPGFWEGLEQSWEDKKEGAEAQAAFNLATASALLPIPQALVRWSRFDEEAFYNGLVEAAQHLPQGNREVWIVYYTQKRSPGS